MRKNLIYLMMMAVSLSACGGTSPQVEEATEEKHLAEASQERKEARIDKAQYDPNAERLTQIGSAGAAGTEGASGILVTVNPTASHLADAEAHARHARQHVEAAIKLEKFEDAACVGIPPSERLSCPTLLSDAMVTLVNGVRLHTGPKRLPQVLAFMRCHLAFDHAHGYTDESLCPFAIKGVVANPAADQTGVELTSTDPAAVRALHDLILVPFHGL